MLLEPSLFDVPQSANHDWGQLGTTEGRQVVSPVPQSGPLTGDLDVGTTGETNPPDATEDNRGTGDLLAGLVRISKALGQPVTRFTWRDGMARVTLATGRVVVGISEDKGEAWETVRGLMAR